MEKLEKNIDNIGQLVADMRFKVNNYNLDLKIEIESIKNYLKDIEKKLKNK